MKERLVEDWLTRINERGGYEVPFCQTLASKGYRVLRCGHSPTEHGKDVLAIAPDGAVCAYQLKSGDTSQAEMTKHHGQLCMLVETRPIHPALPSDFVYRPSFVTTGEFTDPAISLIKELNAGWQHRRLPALELINGRRLLVDFLGLSSDFWPVEAPAVREFRELYLVDGRGDFEVAQLAKFLRSILREKKSGLELERRAAAANIFAGYLLGPFYEQGDHWSIFQGWTVCASHLAWAGESGEYDRKHWEPSFELAKGGAFEALRALEAEVLADGAFRVSERELDDYTRVRNTTAVAAVAACELVRRLDGKVANFADVSRVIDDFLRRGRFLFWGEGAFSQFLVLIWFLESANLPEPANAMLLSLIRAVSERNSPDSEQPYDDPYVSADEFLQKTLRKMSEPSSATRRQTVESYTLFPLVLLAARRGLRPQLTDVWKQISHVRLAWFRPDDPADALLWHCEKGKEYDAMFDQPQSWRELCEVAFRDDQDRLPSTLRKDLVFALMFTLAFPHRILPSLTKHLDAQFRS